MATENPQLIASAQELIRHLNSPKDGQQLSDEFVNDTAAALLASPGGQELIKALQEALKTKSAPDDESITVHTTAVKKWAHNTTATGSLGSVLAWAKARNDVPDLHKSWSGSGWGFSIPGGGFLKGDLYYDNENDLRGKCWAYIGTLSAYSGITYCHEKNVDTAFASFQALNLGVGGTGGFWMEGDWN